jgi:hypothetical protein
MPTDQHDRLCAAVADALKTNAGVSGIVADRVFGPNDTVAGTPCVIVSKGKAPAGIPGQLRQFGVRVESRAESESELNALLVAVQKVINGFRRGEVKQCVLMDTGPHLGTARTDAYGVFAKAD